MIKFSNNQGANISIINLSIIIAIRSKVKISTLNIRSIQSKELSLIFLEVFIVLAQQMGVLDCLSTLLYVHIHTI